MAEERGFFDNLSTIGNVVGFASNPVGATVSMLGQEIASNRSSQAELENENMPYNDPFSSGYGSFGSTPAVTPNNAGGFFGNLGQTIGGFGRDVSGFVQDIAPALDLFGIGGRTPSSSSGSARTVQVMGAEETADSGQLLGANLGMAPALFQAGRSFLRTPGGQTAWVWRSSCRCVAIRGLERPTSDHSPNEKRRSKDLYDGWNGPECHRTDIK